MDLLVEEQEVWHAIVQVLASPQHRPTGRMDGHPAEGGAEPKLEAHLPLAVSLGLRQQVRAGHRGQQPGCQHTPRHVGRRAGRVVTTRLGLELWWW